MSELYVGLMSGTSLDGVDAALVDFSDGNLRLVATHFLPYPPSVRAEALALNAAGPDELHRSAALANELSELYARAVQAALNEGGVTPATVQAIGNHGQTVRHRPDRGYTLQLQNPALLAERTGIRVVADFRARDIAAGGQGAPLVPAFHAACFRHATKHRALLNIGGIANLTNLPPQGRVQGFDTGPGNLLMDAWCVLHTGSAFDRDGAWAASGKPIPQLLQAMLQDPYFSRPPPKSTGRDEFHMEWLNRFDVMQHAPVDIQATLLDFTAQSAAGALSGFCSGVEELYVCGGGAANKRLMERLQVNLPGIALAKTDALGVPPDWMEAIAFAWLARQCLLGLPGNLASVTGAAGPRILGAIYPA